MRRPAAAGRMAHEPSPRGLRQRRHPGGGRRGPGSPDRRSTSGRSPGRCGCASSAWRATRSPTAGTTAASTRRSTRSRARTSTGGSERLGEHVRRGGFGENLTTEGLDVNEAVLGEHWRIGTALLVAVEVRIPCNTFKTWMGREGFDATAWVKRFAAENRPGPYLRVLEEGTLRAGDEIVVEHRPEHGVSVSHDVPGADGGAGAAAAAARRTGPARGGVRRRAASRAGPSGLIRPETCR